MKLAGRIIVALGAMMLFLSSVLAAASADPEDPWDDYECTTWRHHSGRVPDSYDVAFFFERGFFDNEWVGPVPVPDGGLNFPPPEGRRSWDKVKKCKGEVPPTTTTTSTTTTTTTPPTTTSTTTTVPPTTTTTSTTTTVPPTTTTTVPPTTTTTTTTTTVPPTTTSTVPPTTSTTVPEHYLHVDVWCEWENRDKDTGAHEPIISWWDFSDDEPYLDYRFDYVIYDRGGEYVDSSEFGLTTPGRHDSWGSANAPVPEDGFIVEFLVNGELDQVIDDEQCRKVVPPTTTTTTTTTVVTTTTVPPSTLPETGFETEDVMGAGLLLLIAGLGILGIVTLAEWRLEDD